MTRQSLHVYKAIFPLDKLGLNCWNCRYLLSWSRARARNPYLFRTWRIDCGDGEDLNSRLPWCKQGTLPGLSYIPKFGWFYPPLTQISTHRSLLLSGICPSGHTRSMKSTETVLEIVRLPYFLQSPLSRVQPRQR